MRRRTAAIADEQIARAAMIDHYTRDIAERGYCAEVMYGRVLAALLEGRPVTLPGSILARYVPGGTFDRYRGYVLESDGAIREVPRSYGAGARRPADV